MEREKVITLLRLVKENGLKIDIAADEICSLFSVSNFVLLAKPNYLHKDGKISSACYKIVGEQKIYFTHKDNLYSR